MTLAGEDESNFVRVHDRGFIAGHRRLYMTATPRVYGESAQQVARDADAALCSMDNPVLFGETLFTRSFGWAVENGLLTDYRVIVLAVNEADVSASVQSRLADENSELVLDDATKIVGCSVHAPHLRGAGRERAAHDLGAHARRATPRAACR
jgi:predicted helicase